MKNKKLTIIDLFTSCGGLTEGFLKSGKYKGLAHVEWELPMVRTLRSRLEKKWNHSKNTALKRVIHFDIQRTDELLNGNWSDLSLNSFSETNHASIIKNGLKGLVRNTKVDLVVGGPPCQAYSMARRSHSNKLVKDDYRNYLFESFIKVVDEFRPSVFVFENVEGMLSAAPGGRKVTDRIFEAFDNCRYDIYLYQKN
ncbi:DNA cytosine methyltransferase [Lutimonas vermicola]|uniref:DNA (cytosine-5-)-methyltransferase n=1 Tax=Lutimonas vermicola TaxID=414288 RepID=A0ABU9KXC8_9FLAO